MNMALAPVINHIEVCRDEQNFPQHLRLQGENLLLGDLFHVILDGDFCPCSALESGGPSPETLVQIPNPKIFDYIRSHSLIFTTPYGLAMKRF